MRQSPPEYRTARATELATAAKLCIVRSLLRQIGRPGSPLVSDSVIRCKARIDRERWQLGLNQRLHLDSASCAIASIAGVSVEMVDAIFRPHSLDLMADELRTIIREAKR